MAVWLPHAGVWFLMTRAAGLEVVVRGGNEKVLSW